jgi:uncharacterized repeat protein (TIGR01451 family)
MKLFIASIIVFCTFSLSADAVTNSADLAVEISSPQTVATNGQLVTYYIHAINHGPENISADDSCEIQFLPPDGQYTGTPISSGPGTISYDINGIVIWNPGTINNGQTLIMTVTVRINTADDSLNIAETADVYYSNSNSYDPNSGNNYASLQHIFQPAADLSLKITDEYGGTNTWSSGQGAYQIRIAVSNAGPSVITNMVVTNMLPDNATFSITWPEDNSHYNLNGRTLTWWPGGNYLYTESQEEMLIDITPTTTGVKTVTSTLYCDSDTTSGNNQATHTMNVIPPPITVTLGIDGWDIVPTINRYGTIEYYLRVYNDGTEDAPDVIVSNTLPPNTIFESSTPSQGYTTTNGQFVTWYIGTVAAATTNNIHLFVRPLESGTITNIAEVFSGADINETTNTIIKETTDINPGPPICTVMPAISTNATMGGAWIVAQIETNNVIASNILITATVTRGPHMNNSTNALTQLYPAIPELTNAVALFKSEDENGYPGLDRISITGHAGIIPFSVPAEILWEMMDTQEYLAGTSALISNGLNRYTIDIDDSFDIYKASVKLLFYHSWPGNLQLRLISPDNITIMLWNENAAMDPADTAPGMWVGSSNQYCIIDDNAGTNITAGTEPFAGEYTTETLSLSNLVEEFSQGTWTLEIQDMYPADNEGGTLYEWGIELVPDDGDIDDDEMNDSWEISHGLNPANPSDANTDSDGDGASSWLEYHSGTNPTNSSDSFAVVSSGHPLITGNEVTIEWRSQSNLFYSIEQSTNLLTGFLPILTGIEATPPTNSVVITNSVYGKPCFYKVAQEE